MEDIDENNVPVPFDTQSAKVLLTNLANRICPIIRFEITDRIVLHKEPCTCGNSRPWLTLEGRTDDILIFENGIRIAPLSIYAILKEVHGIERFQLIQHENGVTAEIYLSDYIPSANPISGKFKHIIAKSK